MFSEKLTFKTIYLSFYLCLVQIPFDVNLFVFHIGMNPQNSIYIHMHLVFALGTRCIRTFVVMCISYLIFILSTFTPFHQ